MARSAIQKEGDRVRIRQRMQVSAISREKPNNIIAFVPDFAPHELGAESILKKASRSRDPRFIDPG